jgi:hypothetical protein
MQDDGSMEYRLIGQELKNSDGDKVSYDENLHPKLTGRMRRQAEYLVQSSLRIVPETSSYAAIQKSLMRERPESCIAAAAPAPAPVRFAPPEEITVNPLYQIAQRYRDNPRDLLPAEERRNFLVQFYDDRSEDKTPYIMIRQQWRPDSARLNLDYIDRMNHHRYTCQDCHISIYQDLFNKYGMNCDYHVTLNYVDTHPSGKTPQRRAHLYYHIDKDTLEPVLLAATMKDDIRAKTDHSWQEFDAEQHGGQLQELFSRPMGQLLADYYEHNHHSRPYRR